MAQNLYVTATEARSGKSAVSLGLMEMLLRKTGRVAFFQPLISDTDFRYNTIGLISSHFKLQTPHEQMYGFTMKEAARLISGNREAELIEGIIAKYNILKKEADFVLCEGTDLESSALAFELDINAEISRNLSCPVLLVARAHRKDPDAVVQTVKLSLESLVEKGCHVIATIINRVAPEKSDLIMTLLKEKSFAGKPLIYAVPNDDYLARPAVGEIARDLRAQLLYGEKQLNRHVYGFTVAAMHLQNFLPRIKRGSLIITPGDRGDVIVACLAALYSGTLENISGIVLTGGLKPERPIRDLINGFPETVPILSVREDTFPTAHNISKIRPRILVDDKRKIAEAIAIFEKYVDADELGEKIVSDRISIVTPKMFEYRLLQKARTDKRHIVLPEGDEERILNAADRLLRRDAVEITLLGNEDLIRGKIAQAGVQLDRAKIVDPLKSDLFEGYAQTYYHLRKHKGITRENASDVMGDRTYFATMMVYKGHAHGMVSGAVHSTASTIRPALEFIKTRPGFSIVSSVFLMCLTDRVLVYGDCAVNPDPDPKQLAEIALSSAHTAVTFGIEPVVAMLSYSTGQSGRGRDVDKVREATRIAREMARDSFPGLSIEGPIQYDAAIDPVVARTKLPDSSVAGRATVFIFPDLNTGNNTYKAVQRSAGAVAIGPVLQGLRYPVNDLSRGCTVTDIVNTVAITAIQAQEVRE